MPWKKNYTISDEIGMRDADVPWPDNRRCCFSIVVDLSVASGPSGITESDLLQPTSQFGMNEGLERTLAVLQRFRRRATFVVPAAMAGIYADRISDVVRLGHEIAAGGYLHEDVTNLELDRERDRIAFTTEARGWPRSRSARSVRTPWIS